MMLPMLTTLQELDQALRLINRAWRELVEEGLDVQLPKMGIMLEVPAAIYQAREFARRVDFLSVGTNDLTQYLLAVDRNNPRVAALYNHFHPSVLRVLSRISEDVHAEGKTVSVCGEMAGDPAAAVLLMAMGYDMLSMNANHLPKVKSIIRSVSMVDAKRLLADVLVMDGTQAISSHLFNTLSNMGISPRLLPAQTEN
jgi:phosphotransferase system enzyme I (PtsP)